MAQPPLSPKQIEFVLNGTRKWNIAHGSVRSGKTEGTLYAFMHSIHTCPDSQIYMVGHSSSTIYDNVIRLLFDNSRFLCFKPHCTWMRGARELYYKDKKIITVGSHDAASVAKIQGKTMSRLYCDEMTLFPEAVIDMLDTRLSLPYSMGFASMNPAHPTHRIKQWIDKGLSGDKNYYSLHFTLEDNPFLDDDYKQRIRTSTSGVFHKRNYLGLWCLAEGAVFDFFDRDQQVVKRPPRASTEYYVAGIDVGTSNAFACVIIGVSTGKYTQMEPQMWVEKEYYWNPKETGKQKTNSEFADDIQELIYPYGVRQVYIDPSAAAFKQDLRRRSIPTIDADNDVYNGICKMGSMLRSRELLIMDCCPNLIREIESYTWDSKASERGEDKPTKRGDHAIDATRYVVNTHKVPRYQPYKEEHRADEYLKGRFNTGMRSNF